MNHHLSVFIFFQFWYNDAVMIKNIIFDIGGVLVDFNPLRVLLENMSLPKEKAEVIAEHTFLCPLWNELDRGEQKEIIFEKMIEQIPEQYKEEARIFLYERTLETVTSFDYSRNFIQSLKDKGLKIYLLTNYPSWMFYPHFEKVFTFSDLVDGRIVSGDVKLIKPDERIYSALLEKYNLIAEESIFLDDRKVNIDAANKLGIHGIHFVSREIAEKEMQPLLDC